MDSVEKAGSNWPKSGRTQQARRAKGGSGWVSQSILPEQVDGPSGMSLPKFIVGLIFALAIVVAWSFLGGASLGTTFFRVVAGAIVIQLGYFLLVFAMVVKNAQTSADRIRQVERKLGSSEDGEKFSARRSLR
jgi:exopolysaccharide production repressor protein